jgi:hypothetical protein
MKRIYTREMLEEAVTKSISYSDVCRFVGIKKAAGSSYELIKNRIAEYQIDISHFLGKSAYAGKRNSNYEKRKTANDILVDGYEYRASHRILERALIEIGIRYNCSVCELDSWLGKKITLDVDHIDGNWKNCTRENLRFICPNCHRQTDTFGGKNKS